MHITSYKSSIEISYPDPILITSPILLSLFNAAIKPLTVSSIYEKSLVGYNAPKLIVLLLFNNCVIIVGIIALLDCLGP